MNRTPKKARATPCTCDGNVESVYQCKRHGYDKLCKINDELSDVVKSILDLPIDDYGERTIPAGFLDKARAAIAKAEGRIP